MALEVPAKSSSRLASSTGVNEADGDAVGLADEDGVGLTVGVVLGCSELKRTFSIEHVHIELQHGSSRRGLKVRVKDLYSSRALPGCLASGIKGSLPVATVTKKARVMMVLVVERAAPQPPCTTLEQDWRRQTAEGRLNATA